MTSDPRAVFALDLGSATAAVALIGRINNRWRLLAADSAPAGGDVKGQLERLVGRLASGDPDLVHELGLDSASLDSVARLEAHTAELMD